MGGGSSDGLLPGLPEELVPFSEHSVLALNRLHAEGWRRGFYAEYYWDLPEEVQIQVLDASGAPIPGARVDVHPKTLGRYGQRALDPFQAGATSLIVQDPDFFCDGTVIRIWRYGQEYDFHIEQVVPLAPDRWELRLKQAVEFPPYCTSAGGCLEVFDDVWLGARSGICAAPRYAGQADGEGRFTLPALSGCGSVRWWASRWIASWRRSTCGSSTWPTGPRLASPP